MGGVLKNLLGNLKIDSEIAEIIEVNVATCHIETIFLPLCNSKVSFSKMRGGNCLLLRGNNVSTFL